MALQLLKRITKHRLGRYPCQTAVMHLQTASACSIAEREDPSVVALLNTIDLERKIEPELQEQPEDAPALQEQAWGCRDDYDADGVLLVGNGRSADAQEVCILQVLVFRCSTASFFRFVLTTCVSVAWHAPMFLHRNSTTVGHSSLATT
jgi:hypothetical protein